MTTLPESKAVQDFIIHQEGPKGVNAEPHPGKLLDGEFTTSREHAYLRNHGEILQIPREGYKLRLDTDNRSSFASDGDLAKHLKAGFIDLDTLLSIGRTDLTAALQCAGNRREEMSGREDSETEGLQWGPASILNAEWSGVPLRQLLFSLGMTEEYAKDQVLSQAHIHFTSKQACEKAEEYAASIPLVDALEESRCLLLADRMNGEDLPEEHGAPLRLIAPGMIGARSVKWLYSISIRSEPSSNFYMTSDYKKLPSWVGSEDKSEWLKSVDPLQVSGLQCAIAKVEQHGSDIRVAGYATNGSGSPIDSVQVCVQRDIAEQKELVESAVKEGDWMEAELEKEEKPSGEKVFSWTLFSASIPMKAEWNGKELAVLSRARSEKGEEQKPLADWNVRGVQEDGYGQYHGFICFGAPSFRQT